MRAFIRIVHVAAWLVAMPALALAQGTLTGTVRDPSGAVLPGVTVEAASPALIEKVRSVVSDGAGVYRIVELPPGTYALTFILPGFSTVTRQGLELAGEAVLTIPVEMRVGALQETITVTGETPVVDVQSVRRQAMFEQEIIQVVPATRAVGSLLNITPGLTVDNNGLAPTPTMTFFSARGGQANEGRMTVNGMVVAAAFNGGGVSSYIYDSVNADEVSVVVSGGLGEQDIGGPVMNLVPRAGGNRYTGQAFYNVAGDEMLGGWARGNNLNDALRAPSPGPGLRETPGIIAAFDTSVSYGGPIRRDRLWFYGSYRRLHTTTAVEGIVANANAGNPARWDWVADNTITARRFEGREMFIGRFTGQLGTKHRISVNHEYQVRCEGSPLTTGGEGCHGREANWIALGSATTSPEANTGYYDFPYYVTQAIWTAPMTNRLLLEAGLTRFSYYHAGGPGQVPPDGIFDDGPNGPLLDLIGVSEQSTAINPATGLPYAPRANYAYRALTGYSDNYGNPNSWRASASYVTGSHNLKVGYQGTYLVAESTFVVPNGLLNYRFNQGQPNQFTFRLPTWQQADRTRSMSFFVQDAWTRGRLTLSGALRYDRAWSYSPAEHNGTELTSRLNATPFRFERTIGVDAFNDVTPRFGVAYDVFGNGKTALKFNMGHYLDAATNDSAYTRNNPAARVVRSVNRSWQDLNGNRIVDCDILNPAAQTAVPDTCGALSGNDLNFGGTSATLTQVDPETLRGWGVRENDWQWGVSVQQEIVPRVSVDVSFNRRWFYGQTSVDNLNRDPLTDWDSFVINAPVDSRLPDGGGYPIRVYSVKPTAGARAARNYITFDKRYGERRDYWHGVDVTLNARFRNGLFVQAGTNTGRAVRDTCDIVPKIDSPDTQFCHSVEPFLTTLRGLAIYTIPVIDVLVSATMRSQPPLPRVATWNVPNSVIAQPQYLGRVPFGGTLNGNTAITLFDNDQRRLYADNRRTQIDMRFAKILRFGGTRTDIGVDLGNLLNTNYATGYENTYQYSVGNTALGGTWNNPTSVYTPRYARINLTFNF